MPYVPPPPPLTTLQERIRQGILSGLGVVWPSKFNPDLENADGEKIGHRSVDGLARGIGQGVLSGIGGFAETVVDLSTPRTGPNIPGWTKFNTSRQRQALFFDPKKSEYLYASKELDHQITGDTVSVHMHFSLGAAHSGSASLGRTVRFRVEMDLAKLSDIGDPPEPFVFLPAFDLTATVAGPDYAYQLTTQYTITDAAAVAAIAESSGIGVSVTLITDSAAHPGDNPALANVFPIALGLHYLADKIGTDNPFPPYEA